MRLSLATICLLVAVVAGSANAEIKWGLTSFDVGLGFVDTGIDLGTTSVGGTIGFQVDAIVAQLAERVFLEGGVNYWATSETIDWRVAGQPGRSTFDFSDLTLYANAIYQFPGDSTIRWYAGGGLGLHFIEGGGSIQVEGQADAESNSETDLGIQLVVGGAYEWTDRWAGVGEFAYVSVNSTSHPAIIIGVRRFLD